MNDNDIVKLFEDRLESAIYETKSKYGRLVRSLCYHILRNMPDSEECESDTYLGIWNTIPPAKPESFRAYVLKIARNQALKRYEYNHAQKRDISKNVSYEEYEEMIKGAGVLENSADHVSESKLNDDIDCFLQELSPRNRKVFMLRYWYFMSVKEIMHECGLSKSNVESILFRTRRSLKKFLTEKRYYL